VSDVNKATLFAGAVCLGIGLVLFLQSNFILGAGHIYREKLVYVRNIWFLSIALSVIGFLVAVYGATKEEKY